MEFIEINDIWFNTAAIVSIEPVGDGPDYKEQCDQYNIRLMDGNAVDAQSPNELAAVKQLLRDSKKNSI